MLIRVFTLPLLLLALCAYAPQAPAVARDGHIPVEEFATLPYYSHVIISPGGRHVAARLRLDNRHALVVYDLDAPDAAPFVLDPGDLDLHWLAWANDERLLLSFGFARQRYGTPTTETRLFAMDADGGNGLFLLSPRQRDESPLQIADNVVHLLPDQPDHILMSFNRSDPSRPQLWRVNINTGREQQVAPGRRGITRWTVDQQLNPRIGAGVDGSAWRIQHRAPDSRRWEVLREFPVDSGQEFSPVLFDRDDPDLLYVISNELADTSGLYLYRISTDEYVETVFVHPERDVMGIHRVRGETGIAGVYFSGDDDFIHWLDDWFATELERANTAIPDRHAQVASTTADRSRLVLRAGAASLPGNYYVYEPGADRLMLLGSTYPELEGRALAGVRSISYEARDGLTIPGFLTLPPGAAGQPLPAVILPHGGPHARDYAMFDPLLQLLANRGYAVLQMNFRGSTGYGTEFRTAGFRQWGQAMQDDVTDGTRWLVEQGIADPERICIVGGSYGGYAALMGVVTAPELYACAVSINGVSDLPRLLNHFSRYVGGRAALKLIGESWSDRAMLADNSPVNRAEDIAAPVLLIHASGDRVVPLVQSSVMARALQRAGKPHTYLELDGGDHSLSRGDHRYEAFAALDEFLDRHLAGSPATPAARPEGSGPDDAGQR